MSNKSNINTATKRPVVVSNSYSIDRAKRLLGFVPEAMTKAVNIAKHVERLPVCQFTAQGERQAKK